MNRGQLADAIRSYLNRPNLPAADINIMIASVEGELNRELKDHPRNARRTEWTLPTHDDAGNELTDKTNIIPIPVDMAQMKTLKTSSIIYKQYPPGVSDPEVGYVNRGDCLQVYPMPDRGTTFYLNYIAFLRPLQGDADTNWVSNYFADLYLYGTLKEAAVFLKNERNLSLWQKEFLRRLDGVRRQGWGQNIASSPRVRVV